MVSETETTSLHLLNSSHLFTLKESCIFEDKCTVKTSTQSFLKTQNSVTSYKQCIFYIILIMVSALKYFLLHGKRHFQRVTWHFQRALQKIRVFPVAIL